MFGLSALRGSTLRVSVLSLFLAQIFYQFCLTLIVSIGLSGSAQAQGYKIPICSADGIRFIQINYENELPAAGELSQNPSSEDSTVPGGKTGEQEQCLLCIIGQDKALSDPDLPALQSVLSGFFIKILTSQEQCILPAANPSTHRSRAPPQTSII